MSAMSSNILQSIKEVDIDPEGTFKYILIKVNGSPEGEKVTSKMIVRGYKHCPYHGKYYIYVFICLFKVHYIILL